MIRIHHLDASRSHRILWLLEELGLGYEIVSYQRDRKTMLAPRNLRDVHPLGKAPVVEIDGEVLAESGAIVEILVQRNAPTPLAPAHGTPAWERYVYWLHYAEGSAMPPLLLKLLVTKLGPLGWPARRYVDGQLKLHLDYLERHLGTHAWFAGDAFSAADVMMSFPVEAALSRAGREHRPKLAAFLERIHARPAYRRAEERGGRLRIL
jgi:glutathione S-transferase